MGELIFEARAARFRYPTAAVDALRDITLEVRLGELVALVGPNGSGKTTLARLLLGVVEPDSGEVLAAGRPAARWDRRGLARLVGVVAQREEPVFPLKVHQAVLLGRYPHLGPLGTPSRDDRAAVESAMQRCDVAHLRDRWVGTLSGGEWQRVRVARALAQAPRALVLDEATASLDVRHEMEVLELVAALVRDEGLAALVVTHHVNLAARFADRIVVMDRGAARAQGAPAEVITREVLERVFGWPVALSQWRDVPQFVPLRKGETEDEDHS
jgi:iron complex transport system ATP-binding protein